MDLKFKVENEIRSKKQPLNEGYEIGRLNIRITNLRSVCVYLKKYLAYADGMQL